jgi:hypothetical protein
MRGGDELMAVGLGIEPRDPIPAGAAFDGIRMHEGMRVIRGDFEARLFELRRL